jgi:hypothetical protein
VNEPQINVDHFYHRPIYHVVGLLTDKLEIQAITRDLESAGVDVTAVEILCGERGAAILDEDGRYHGLRGRVVRAFQQLGYDQTTLAIYDEALRDGELVLHVPARPADRGRIAALLQRHHVHDVGYFGPGTFAVPHRRYRLTPICPEQRAALAARASRTSRRARRLPERRVTPGDEVRPADSPGAEPAHTRMAASNLDRKVMTRAMAPGPGNLSRRVARWRHELGLTREQVAHRAGMAASGLPPDGGAVHGLDVSSLTGRR